MKASIKTLLLSSLAASFSLLSHAASPEVSAERAKIAGSLSERIEADYKELSAKGEEKEKLEDFRRFQELYDKYAEQRGTDHEGREGRDWLKGEVSKEEAAKRAESRAKEAEARLAEAKEAEAKAEEAKAESGDSMKSEEQLAEAKTKDEAKFAERRKAMEDRRMEQEKNAKGLRWSLEKDGKLLQCLEDGKVIAEFKTANLLSGLPEEYIKKLGEGSMSDREVLALVKLCAEARAKVDGIKFINVSMTPVRSHSGPKYDPTAPVIPGGGLDGTGLEHSAPGAPAPPLPLIIAFGVAAIAKFRKGVRRAA